MPCGTDRCPACGPRNAGRLALAVAEVVKPKMHLRLTPGFMDGIERIHDRMRTLLTAIGRAGPRARMMWVVEHAGAFAHVHALFAERTHDDVIEDAARRAGFTGMHYKPVRDRHAVSFYVLKEARDFATFPLYIERNGRLYHPTDGLWPVKNRRAAEALVKRPSPWIVRRAA